METDHRCRANPPGVVRPAEGAALGSPARVPNSSRCLGIGSMWNLILKWLSFLGSPPPPHSLVPRESFSTLNQTFSSGGESKGITESGGARKSFPRERTISHTEGWQQRVTVSAHLLESDFPIHVARLRHLPDLSLVFFSTSLPLAG